MNAPDKRPSRIEYVPSSPFFFRLIRRAMLAFAAAACALAAFFPAPLQEPANIAKVPNPAKSAWFLLWIQELVGYSRHLVYLVFLLGLFFLLLPYARWNGEEAGGDRSRKAVAAIAVAVFSLIVVLTVVAYFFRGRNWALCVGP